MYLTTRLAWPLSRSPGPPEWNGMVVRGEDRESFAVKFWHECVLIDWWASHVVCSLVSSLKGGFGSLGKVWNLGGINVHKQNLMCAGIFFKTLPVG